MIDLLAVVADPRLDWPTGHRIAWMIHLLGVIVWIGGLLLLTRFLAMHSRSTDDTEKRFYSDIEKRIHRGAVFPGLLLALLGGLWSLTAYNMANMKMGWFHAKLFIALVFVAIQAYSFLKMMEFSREQPTKPNGLLMGIHMAMGVLLIAILYLIRFRPF